MDAPQCPENRHFLAPRNYPAAQRQDMVSGEKLAEIEPAILTCINFSSKGDHAFGAVPKNPTATLIRASRSQLMQVNIGGGNVRQIVFR
jgi:hypothetical protein